MNKKAVVLLSGGLDSTTCLAYAKDRGYEVYALSFDYGQRHRAELESAKVIANAFSAAAHQVVSLPMSLFNASSLVGTSEAVPDYVGGDEIPSTYVPARNTIFLSMALGWAEVVGAETVFIGASSVDYSGYPDCRPEYFSAFQQLATLATKTAVEGYIIKLETPLLYLGKADTIKLGVDLGVDYSMTVSCYQATNEGLACGRCDSCHLRKQGFEAAGVLDPTKYID